MALSLEQRKKLIAVIQSLFTSLGELTAFIKDNTGRNVQEIIVGNLYVTRSQLVTNAESREWVAELIEALKDVAGPEARATLESIDVKGSFAKPQVDSLRAAMQQSLTTDDLLLILKDSLGKEVAAGNIDSALADAHFVALAKAVRGQSGSKPELRKPLEELGLLTPTPSNLEKIVNDANSFLNLGVWLRRLTDIEGYVCRIAVDGPAGLKAKGSGFLVGPSTVLTNHHVVASALSKQIDPKRLRMQFDYRVLRDGSMDAGTIVELDHSQPDSWRVDFAPHSVVDTKVHPIEEEPEPEALDYALLRLAKPIGAMPIGAVAGDASTLPKRGWMDLEAHGETSKPNSAVFIVQHPSGLPIKLALDTEGVIGYSPNERRMRYRTNTLAGSSGSPVFNQDLEIMALHHAGDPEYPDLNTGKYNEGIPIPALLKRFANRGLLAKLAE